jgi:hypothetical protein
MGNRAGATSPYAGSAQGRVLPGSSSQSFKSFLDHILRVFRQFQLGQFFLLEPPNLGGVAGGAEFSPYGATEKID